MPDRSGSAVVAALIAALAAAPSAADGFYVELEPGVAMLADADLTVSSNFFDGGEATGDMEGDPTWLIGGSVGFRWGGLRVEADASRRELDIGDVSLRDPDLPGGGGDIGDGGDLTIYVGLANLFYGMRFGRIEPFVGAGLGFADLDIDASYGVNVLDVDEGSTEFAWSLSGGASFEVHERVAVSLAYRYVGMTDPDFATLPYTDTAVRSSAEVEVVLHEVLLGIRYDF
jgi:opacity protein-like surface antigen